MSNMFKKRDEVKKIIADDILSAGKKENKSVSTSVNSYVNIDTNKKNNSSRASIIIPKKENTRNKIKRQTYYLSISNIENIKKFADEAGMGKSEFLNNLLDNAFEKLKIE